MSTERPDSERIYHIAQAHATIAGLEAQIQAMKDELETQP